MVPHQDQVLHAAGEAGQDVRLKYLGGLLHQNHLSGRSEGKGNWNEERVRAGRVFGQAKQGTHIDIDGGVSLAGLEGQLGLTRGFIAATRCCCFATPLVVMPTTWAEDRDLREALSYSSWRLARTVPIFSCSLCSSIAIPE